MTTSETKDYVLEGFEETFKFTPNGSPLAGVMAVVGESLGIFTADVNLSSNASRKTYANEAAGMYGFDADALKRALNEICTLRTEEIRKAQEKDSAKGESETSVDHKPPDGVELLENLAGFIRRFVALSDQQARISALWIVHTHAFDSADTTPYLNIKSAEKRSGKTRLLEVLALLTANPWLTGRVTSAVLVRKVAAERPTLLLDESDAAFGADKEYAETLRGVLNAGFRRGGVASLCVGQGTGITYEDFAVFGPKAIAGIGRLPDTVADRSIPVELRRRRQSEGVERFRLRKVRPEARPLREGAAAWAAAHLEVLASAEPELPDALDDRAQDIMEPLLAIADEAGAGWPEHARGAAVSLLAGEEREDADSLGVRLLHDIRAVFDEAGAERLATGKMLDSLTAMEEAPWGSLRGEALDARGLARFLKRYGVKPEKLREGEDTFRGYRRAGFEDAWARYAPDAPDYAEHPEHPEHEPQNPHRYAESAVPHDVPHSSGVPHDVPDAERSKPHTYADVPRVPHVPHKSDTPADCPREKCIHDYPGGVGCYTCDPNRPHRRKNQRKKSGVRETLEERLKTHPRLINDTPENIAAELFIHTDLEPTPEEVAAALKGMKA
ncbi:MAG: DUF3631 domain-containing protein [Rubrobacter sp.]|nr:DUF3631 domain-containing protein [Rubrobacter sp.]